MPHPHLLTRSIMKDYKEPLQAVDPIPAELPREPEDNEKKVKGGSRLFPFLQKVQRYSSYSFTAFLTLHAASVIVAPVVSPELGNSTMQFTSAVYQAPAVEPILVYGSALAHVGAGLVLRAHKLYLDRVHYNKFLKGWANPTVLSGYVLMPIVVGHAVYHRIAPQWILGDSSMITLDYVAYSVHHHPILAWSALLSLVGVGVFHVSRGWHKWLGAWNQWKMTMQSAIISATAIAFSSVSVFRIGQLPEVTGWISKQYHQVLEALYID